MKFVIIILIVLINNFLGANEIAKDELKKQIGRMLVVGFEDSIVDKESKIVKQIQKYDLGGVILFDRFYNDRKRIKNIASPSQLKLLTSQLQLFSNKPLLISIDQEGGKVARLKPKYGFLKVPSAKNISKMDILM